MRHLAILMAVLSITVCANAAINIVMSGTELAPNDTAIVSLVGDGATLPGIFYLGITEGDPGSLDGSQMVPPPPIIILPPEPPVIPGLKDVIVIDLFDMSPPGQPLAGMLVDNIIFHCDGPGFVRVVLVDQDMNFLDAQLVYQTPEPATIGLMGLGFYLLRKKRA
jgi:hypothetical protein